MEVCWCLLDLAEQEQEHYELAHQKHRHIPFNQVSRRSWIYVTAAVNVPTFFLFVQLCTRFSIGPAHWLEYQRVMMFVKGKAALNCSMHNATGRQYNNNNCCNSSFLLEAFLASIGIR